MPDGPVADGIERTGQSKDFICKMMCLKDLLLYTLLLPVPVSASVPS